MPQLTVDEIVFQQLVEDIRDIRQSIGAVSVLLSQTANEYGQRIARVEVRSSIFATILGAIAGGIASFFGRN
jgi:hypothetical protein